MLYQFYVQPLHKVKLMINKLYQIVVGLFLIILMRIEIKYKLLSKVMLLIKLSNI